VGGDGWMEKKKKKEKNKKNGGGGGGGGGEGRVLGGGGGGGEGGKDIFWNYAMSFMIPETSKKKFGMINSSKYYFNFRGVLFERNYYIDIKGYSY